MKQNWVEKGTPEAFNALGLRWNPEPVECQPLPGGGVRVKTAGNTDYFNDPFGKIKVGNAPFLFTETTGDFVAQACVRPQFSSTYDAGVLMVYADDLNWIKFCFEKTDLGPTAAVSVITHGTSDDANGVVITSPFLWMQIVRVGDVFGLHDSPDGESWQMVRMFHLALPAAVRVGLVAQCPVGNGTHVDFTHFSVENRTLADLRSGKA